MGLRAAIARHAVHRVHVLVVEVPGWGETRMRVEAEIVGRGWTVATSPADADVLLVCGLPGQKLEAVCARIWSQLPGPRARAAVLSAADAGVALEQVQAELIDGGRQQRDAQSRSLQPPRVSEENGPTQTSGHAEHAEHSMHTDAEGRASADDNMDMGMDMPMDMHAGMDMDMGMDMPMPGGIPLAEDGPDRDGLEMDVLHLSLGPVLPHWPAGLVVHCSLQGDVIISAQPEVLTADRQPGDDGPREVENRSLDDERRRAVIRRSEAAMQVLALAGWSFAANRARRVRDDVASGTALVDVTARLDNLTRSVNRSWLLRWTLKGITIGDALDEARQGFGKRAFETVRDRLVGWLEEAKRIAREEQAEGAYGSTGIPTLHRSQMDVIPRLLHGTDVATARLIVAALAIDTVQVSEARESRS